MRACPMCAATRHASHRRLTRDGQSYEVVRCLECRFVYVANPQGDTFEPNQQAPRAVPEKSRHRQIKRLCDRRIRPDASHAGELRVLEVGAGWGGLAQVFARDPRYCYLGLEPSAARAAFCRAHGFDVRQGLFDGPGSVDGRMDAVVFDNVLEHVVDPDRLVGEAAAVLNPGGLLVVIVPNLHDVRQLHPAWRARHHWQPHCHINYFSARDLARLFARHGLGLAYFGLDVVGGPGDDLDLWPRVAGDALGLHLFGLNVFGVSRAAPAD
jgi:SAM-dependent methyltransferase